MPNIAENIDYALSASTSLVVFMIAAITIVVFVYWFKSIQSDIRTDPERRISQDELKRLPREVIEKLKPLASRGEVVKVAHVVAALEELEAASAAAAQLKAMEIAVVNSASQPPGPKGPGLKS